MESSLWSFMSEIEGLMDDEIRWRESCDVENWTALYLRPARGGVLWGHATKHFAAFDLPTFTPASFAHLQTRPDPDLKLSSLNTSAWLVRGRLPAPVSRTCFHIQNGRR